MSVFEFAMVAAEIARHDEAFAQRHPDWEQRYGRLLVDPVVCHDSRYLVDPEDWAPPCGAWDSDHCPCCLLCPGLHADDCEMNDNTNGPGCAPVTTWETTA